MCLHPFFCLQIRIIYQDINEYLAPYVKKLLYSLNFIKMHTDQKTQLFRHVFVVVIICRLDGLSILFICRVYIKKIKL